MHTATAFKVYEDGESFYDFCERYYKEVPTEIDCSNIVVYLEELGDDKDVVLVYFGTNSG